MAKQAASGARIWVDQYDLSGYLNAAGLAIRQDAPIVTCLSDTGPRRLVDSYDHSLDHTGLLDTAEAAYDQIVHELLDNDDHYFAQLLLGTAEGNLAYEQIARLAGQPRSASRGQAQMLNLTAEGAGGMSRGLIIRYGTISGNGNGTGRNVGATTLNQVFQVVIRVFSGTFTSFTVGIEESQNDGAPDAYAPIAGLSQAVTAAGVWRLTTTVATEAWKRVVISVWNGTSAVVGVTAGVVAGT